MSSPRGAGLGAFVFAILSLAVAPYATADDALAAAFDYTLTESIDSAVPAGQVDGVSYLSDCCGEPCCGCAEPSCGCDDCCCGDDVCCGDGCGCGDSCGCGCGAKAGAKPNPCAASHKGVFYANDFSYLKDPCYKGSCLGDCMKLMDTCCGTLDIGGQLRFRYHHEHGMGRSTISMPANRGFLDTDNDFLLSRLRVYTNWKMNDWARFYCEGIFADATANGSYNPRPIDRNHGDLLNCFFDIGLTDDLTFRVGRQELVYGAQRHISPLDWANTRRTFEGVKAMWKSGDVSVDAFYTNFVPVNAFEFDEADYDQTFYGVYATFKGNDSVSYDLFYIGYDDERPYAMAPAADSAGEGSSDFSVHTFGGRMFGGKGQWLYEMEGALQAGRQSGLGLDHRAAMCTCGVGRKLDMKWTPTVWMYYDYASGDDNDGSAFNRYNQLFPLAHKYLGFIDAVQRANISSPNCLITAKPSKKLTLLCWYYYLGAAEEEDVIPFVAVPSAQNTTSTDFGNELDLIAKYQFDARSNILFGYSNLWRGSKIIGTDNANFFYTQWELNF